MFGINCIRNFLKKFDKIIENFPVVETKFTYPCKTWKYPLKWIKQHRNHYPLKNSFRVSFIREKEKRERERFEIYFYWMNRVSSSRFITDLLSRWILSSREALSGSHVTSPRKKRRATITLVFIRISRNAVASVSAVTTNSRVTSLYDGITKNTIRRGIQNHFAVQPLLRT